MQTLTIGPSNLSARLFPAEGVPKGLVLFIHGWQSRQSRWFDDAVLLQKLGYTSLTFDMRGHEHTPGNLAMLTQKDFLDDCLVAYDAFVTSHPVVPVIVIGSSFGSYLACLVSRERHADRLVLRVPADYPKHMFDKVYLDEIEQAYWHAYIAQSHTADESFSLEALNQFSGLVLIIEAGADEIVPHQTVQNYRNAVPDKAQLTYHCFDGAPHSFKNQPEYLKQFQDVLAEWLATSE